MSFLNLVWEKKKGKDMAKGTMQNSGLVKEIQKVLLDDSDFLRVLVQENLQQVVEKEFEEFLQAQPYERTEERQGYRNGSYTRKIKTRVGTIELEVLRDRDGLFSTELFRRYQRNEQAFVLSMIEMYIQGVSTRKIKKVVEALCGTNVSRSMVSSLAKNLDENITKWHNRKLAKEYPYLVVDARYEDIRTEGVVMGQAVMIVIGISSNGQREILSVDIGNSENEQQWSEVFERLKSRGLDGVQYVVSDNNKGLVKALKRTFQGTSWQRCQVHFIRNFMGKFNRREIKEYVLKLKDIFAAPDIKQARERKRKLVKELERLKPKVAGWLDMELESCFTVYNLPAEHRKRMRSTNMIERFNQELLRRSRVIRIFPNVESCIRLFATMCMEQSEQWQTGFKYLDMSLLNNGTQEGWAELARAV
jgi:transposase-like protein